VRCILLFPHGLISGLLLILKEAIHKQSCKKIGVWTLTIAIIPARGGSKRIPGKNIMDLAGYPLLSYTVFQAVNSDLIEEVIVSTDDAHIAEVAHQYGAEVAWRPDDLASDTASSESAVINALDWRLSQGRKDPDNVVLLQATSPIREKNDIDQAISTFFSVQADSLLSVCDTKRFLWALSEKENSAISLNYDYKHRQREQDLEEQFQENGSIYITKTADLRSNNNRLGGKIALYVMSYWTNFQIDEQEDVQLIEWIINSGQVQLEMP